MRLDKYLAHAGIGTRKEVKLLIRKKHICVNGVVCTKDDTHIDEHRDVITFDGEDISYEPVVYLMLNKPSGVISATVDDMHATVFDCIDALLPTDCFPVGRLDIDTEGLLLITNDGKLAHQLLSPSKHVWKTYYVEARDPLSPDDLHILESGTIKLDEEVLKKAKTQRITDHSIYLSIQEGKYHQIKRMLHAVHNEVTYLKRIQMGPLSLDESLAPGEWRYLREDEIAMLRKQAS